MTQKKGFSLMEIIIAMGIFSVAVLIGIGSLLLFVDGQRKALAIQSAYDNLRFTLEVMSKDLRVGSAFSCNAGQPTSPPADCALGQSLISYIDKNGKWVTYQLNNGAIEKNIRDVGNSGQFISITGNDVIIDDLQFIVSGALSRDEGDNRQPVITTVISGRAGKGKSLSTFNLQTSVAQRKKELGE